MANNNDVILTQEGKTKLEEELHYLETEKREEIGERIRVAREFGDISENSEYDDAKNEQAFLEGEIQELEAKIRNTEIFQAGAGDIVQMGSTVVVIDKEFEEDGPETFMVVGSTEADPDEGKISNESPLGQALLGQKSGSVIDVHAPAGIIKYEILAIKG